MCFIIYGNSNIYYQSEHGFGFGFKIGNREEIIGIGHLGFVKFCHNGEDGLTVMSLTSFLLSFCSPNHKKLHNIKAS